MSGPLKWILLLIVVTIRAQDPRRRNFLYCQNNDYSHPSKIINDKFGCSDGKCMDKRFDSSEIGPFWANRGKKDPLYTNKPLFADEPYWLVVRGDNEFLDDPFFLSRGKKENGMFNKKLRDTRDLVQDNDTPFFAARGKRFKVKN